MKKLDIQITKAALESFTVSIGDKEPSISASIALLTEGGKKITSYTINSNAWLDEDKFDVPVSIMPALGQIARALEQVATKHCRDSQKSIAASGTAMNDAPIDLSEIPF